ncbi:MAG: MOSC domain-containing protein [Anaerolineae bacterium]|nr:MOSC domain-containing protein [Anaerolineae bacterium]
MAHIFQINISQGGVPKRAIASGQVTAEGLAGDWQNDRRYHGGPDRALCLFSLEQILALQAAGHPIYPGATGENLTIAGLDWETVRTGARLRLGPEVEIEVTGFASPCRTIAGAFREGAFAEISEKKFPGRSRLYARVLRAGSIRAGDMVQMISPDEAGS